MEADSAYEIRRARDAVEMVATIQSMIDVSANRLEGLRTQCQTSAVLTQQEIRTLEGKLLKHFSRQLVIRQRFEEEVVRHLGNVPNLALWLRVVGLSGEAIQAITNRVSTLESLRDRSDHELRAYLCNVREEEVKRLLRAMHRLRSYTDALARGEAAAEMQLYWDSWERHGRGSPRSRAQHPRGSVPDTEHTSGRNAKCSKQEAKCNSKQDVPSGKSPTTPVNKRKQNSHLPAPAITKSQSHESQLSLRPDASDLSDSQTSLLAAEPTPASPPSSPRVPPPSQLTRSHPNTPVRDPHNHSAAQAATHTQGATQGTTQSVQAATQSVQGATQNTTQDATQDPSQGATHNSQGSTQASTQASQASTQGAPRSPRTPVSRCMAHDIAHRFAKTFNMIATCDYCDKQMLFGSGLKCKECKFKCHKDCESRVPPSCGLPPEFVNAFKEKFHKDNLGGYIVGSPNAARGSLLASLSHRPRKRRTAPQQHTGGPDSSSNTSSCNSSTPSSPAPAAPHTPHTPHPAVKQQFHFPEVKTPVSSPNHVPVVHSPARVVEQKEEVIASVKNESCRVSLSGSGFTDSGGVIRADSLDANKQNDSRWPRQNSLSMKEWDIPYDELTLIEVIGKGRFGTVYRGIWHGAVAVKLLHVQALSDHAKPLDTFKHEVATFRKTRHENLVLFMGACMKPPRLAIVTSLCQGMTLFTHIHLRKDKFNPNKSVLVAQQIAQGMSYLHARGIIHKDLKTKNIFLENGKVVITDFGLFSVTKLCFGNKLVTSARGDSLGIPPGWLCYLAPELIRALTPHSSLHLPFSKATDVYAFGTVWYELLCGDFPFQGQPPEAVIWQVGKGVKQALSNMQASKDIKDILMVCWAYQAAERPDFVSLLSTLEKLPRKRLARSPSHPVQLSRSADSVF